MTTPSRRPVRHLLHLALLGAPLALMALAQPAEAGRRSRRSGPAAIAASRLPEIVALARQSGVPEVRARATPLCILHDRAARRDCVKEGAADPAIEVRLATVRALYTAGSKKEAAGLLRALFADPKVPWRGALARAFLLPEKALRSARRDLLSLMGDAKIRTRADRVREIGRDRGDLALEVLVEGALGRGDPPRAELRGATVGLDPRLDVGVLATLFERGDEELRRIVLGRLETLSPSAPLPGFVRSVRVKEKKAGALTRGLGLLLAHHGDKAAVGYLLSALGAAPDPDSRREILIALLGVADRSVVKTVAPYTNKTSYEKPVRIAAWAVLMRARDAKALGRIERWLREDDVFRREMATRALAIPLGDKALPRLHQLLTDGQPAVRRAAAETLAELARPESTEPLQRALSSSEDREDRRAFARALFRVMPPRRLPEVSYLVSDRDPEIRMGTVLTFVAARNAMLAPYLRPLLHDKSPELRLLALEGIIVSDEKEGMLAFRQALNWIDGSILRTWVRAHGARMTPYVKLALTSLREEIRADALSALELLPAADRVAVATQWIERTNAPDVRIRLLKMLAAASPDRAVALAEKLAQSTDVATRAASIHTLATLNRGADLVVKALDDKAVEVQLEALAGLLGAPGH